MVYNECLMGNVKPSSASVGPVKGGRESLLKYSVCRSLSAFSDHSWICLAVGGRGDMNMVWKRLSLSYMLGMQSLHRL